MFTFILFGGLDYYITEVQYNTVEETANFYLSKMKFAGTLYDEDRLGIIEELQEKGFKNIKITAKDSFGNNLTSENVIVRNTEKVTESTLYLEVLAEPATVPFIFGRLIGVKEEEKFYFRVNRRTLSEKPSF